MRFLGLGSVVSLFVVCFLLEKFTGVKPTIDVKNKFEYVPILTANVIADLLIIIYLTFTRLFYQTSTLESWSAVPKGNNAVLVIFAVMVSGILHSANFDVNIVTLLCFKNYKFFF